MTHLDNEARPGTEATNADASIYAYVARRP